MCKGYLELVHKLLVSWAIWELSFSCVGISWVTSNSVLNYILSWEAFFGRKAKKKMAVVFPRDFFGAF